MKEPLNKSFPRKRESSFSRFSGLLDSRFRGNDGLNQRFLNVRIRALLFVCLLTALHTAPVAALTDPTQPSGTPITDTTVGEPGGWKLSATRITPVKRLAIINGQQVAEGDLIGTARVLRVSHAQVKLDAQGETVTLRLLQSEVKKTR